MEVSRCIKRKIIQANNLTKLKKRLKTLTNEEREILTKYVPNKTRTNYLRPDDGVVRGLEQANIIYRASAMGGANYQFTWAYNIQPWAWDFLNAHSELVSLNSEKEKVAKEKKL